MPQAPLWSVNAVARYEWPAFGGQMSVESDAKWNQQQYLELINAEDRFRACLRRRQCAGRVYRSADGKWEYAAYCKNFTDRWYRIYNLDLSGFLGINQSVFAPPRTFGASVAYRWGK